MATNASGQPITLKTALGEFANIDDYQKAVWAKAIRAERARQETLGYTKVHDEEQGVFHLLDWAQDYARRGEPLKAAALIEAAKDLLAEQVID